MKLNYRGDNMTFEEKLSQMYNEIANKISSMIPVEWEKVYTIAYVDDQGGEVIFNYTKPESEDLKKSSNILKSKMKLNYRGDNMTFEEKLSQMYNEIANEISGMIPVEWEKVYTIAYVDDEGGEVVFNYTKPGSDEEPWTSCEFDFTREGNLKVSFDYIDWIKLGFGPSGKENYYMYKKFGVLPETEYEMEEIREVEKYVKDQE
ncbi:TIGR01741 family protein [Staphylococcus aureus]|nr:TIGR01741 family protein [Staphylococcus aureus]